MKFLKTNIKSTVNKVFTGDHSIVVVSLFTIGGIFMGRSLWQLSYEQLGLPATFLIGAIAFSLAGWYMHRFYDDPNEKNN